ncbi:DUF2339 domain-containing protein [Chryseobacterium nematophagum]|uniref:DUF2339 domain-containing protein n=1 Tax=Chryseobacterium nematophagum TaxID=2305228 RepID=A0A3M7TGK2_9FLAO|nr:DUF2339 domain-containing protein [Chryseobacterium nematophagum]RNA62106.1 DUF2339 domain-containing protein [Chryseobacterium nematophagum]
MEFFFTILVVILILFLYNKLNNRIKTLENELFSLKNINKSNENENVEAIKKPEVQFSNENKQEKEIVRETIIPERNEATPQKEKFNPLFDFLKQNALTIVGILTLVLGIAYFVKYAIDKNWIGELGRVGIGMLAGIGIMLIGYFFRKNYKIFSSIITGGGIAVLYFTITIAFREYHLFTQSISFILICIITLVSIGISYYYKSETLFIFSMLGGFAAPLMISTGESNYLFLFSYISILNIGILSIVFLKNWKSTGWLGFIVTSIYLLYWTVDHTELLSIPFYIINYIVFYVFALKDYFKKNMISSLDILMLVLINCLSTLGLVYIFNDLQYEPVIVFPLIFAIINGTLLLKESRNENFSTNYSVFTGITVSLITIAIALQFKTYLITTVWAIEATLLLFLWKKTNLNIFKICFYILFPLVIIAQAITWTAYISINDLKVIFNPVFLTSFVTIITILINQFLLKKIPAVENRNHSFFEQAYKVLSFGVIYFALLLEIIYHISERPSAFIVSIGLLFTVYYIFALLICGKKIHINTYIQSGLIYLFLVFNILNASFSGSEIVIAILSKKIQTSFYGIHLLYWIPFLLTLWKIIPKSEFLKTQISYWLLSLTIVLMISSELYHLYILLNANSILQMDKLGDHFSILYLPIIWAILASIFIYYGLKKNLSELNKAGVALIAITILKLYAYDVWQMDNISRIIAFIILGIILLLSSFLFQRLKNIIRNMVDKKENDNKNESS